MSEVEGCRVKEIDKERHLKYCKRQCCVARVNDTCTVLLFYVLPFGLFTFFYLSYFFRRFNVGSFDVLTRLWAGQPRDGLIDVRAKKCFFSAVAISALGPFRLPVYWVTSTLSLGVKGRWPKVDS